MHWRVVLVRAVKEVDSIMAWTITVNVECSVHRDNPRDFIVMNLSPDLISQ